MNSHFEEPKELMLQRASNQLQSVMADDPYTLKEKMVLTCHILFDEGHGSGLAGQVTARGEDPGTYYTQQFGLALNEARPDNLLLVRFEPEHCRRQGHGQPRQPLALVALPCPA